MNDHGQRLLELETKVAYQESTIDQLNDTLVRLNAELTKQTEQIRLLAQRLKSMPNSQIADSSEETPPPHY